MTPGTFRQVLAEYPRPLVFRFDVPMGLLAGIVLLAPAAPETS